MLNYRNLKEKSLLLVLAVVVIIIGCSEANSLSAQTPTVIKVSDFGAIPDDGKDDTPAIRAALDKIRNIIGETTLFFARGEYDFFAASAFRAHYPVTVVHKQWDFVTPFHLNGLKDLVIDGGGSTFVMHGRMTPFVLNACKNVKVMRLSIEHERPSVFELKVVAKRNGEIEYEAIANDHFIIEDNRVVWLDADEEMPFFLDLRGFSKVNIGINRIELAEPPGKLARFTDCREINLSPQMILGIIDTPKVELKHVPVYSVTGWKVEGND